MELVLVGFGPWKRVVQPWSWGNGTRLRFVDVKWCPLGNTKKHCIDILWHIQIWVAEKLLTSLEETGNEASKRSKEKITRVNMTCMTLHVNLSDFVKCIQDNFWWKCSSRPINRTASLLTPRGHQRSELSFYELFRALATKIGCEFATSWQLLRKRKQPRHAKMTSEKNFSHFVKCIQDRSRSSPMWLQCQDPGAGHSDS